MIKRILITRRIREGEQEEAFERDFELVEQALTEPLGLPWPDEQTLRNLLKVARAVVFTSSAPMELHPDPDNLAALVRTTGFQAPIPVYAVGPGTAETLRKAGFNPRIPEVFNGTGLAKKILADEITGSVVHFCGNRRRTELRDILIENGIEVSEIVVYKTVLTQNPVWPQGAIDAVAFFSPGAAARYVELGWNARFDGPFAAIGETTADTIRKFGLDTAVAREPSLKGILDVLREG